MLEKLFSARLWIAILIVAAYCYCTIRRISMDAAFVAVVTTVIYAYFNRSDRAKSENKTEAPK